MSWNRYSYTGGDPVNRSDPKGLDWIYDFDSQTWYSTIASGCEPNPAACAEAFNTSVFMYDLDAVSQGYLAFNQAVAFAQQTTPVPSCVQTAITNGAQSGGLDLSAFESSFSVQIVGTPNGQGGTNPFGETELNMTGSSADVQALIGQMCGLGFANNGTSANPWCQGNAGSTPLVGAAHTAPDGTPFTGNFRAPGLTDSLQVNVNPATGQVQMDIDNFNPAAGPWGALLDAVLQVLPNKLTGTDNGYGCPTQ